MEIYKIRVCKNKKHYFDLYNCWEYNGKVWYERVSATFPGMSTKILLGRAINVNNVSEMLNDYKARHKCSNGETSPLLKDC